MATLKRKRIVKNVGLTQLQKKNLLDAFTNFYLHAFKLLARNIRFFGSSTFFPNLSRSRKRFHRLSHLRIRPLIAILNQTLESTYKLKFHEKKLTFTIISGCIRTV